MLTGNLIFWLIKALAAFIPLTAHELTRAVVSTSLGDTLPKKEKRLTLNPLKHFEPIGYIIFIQYGFGWGKPVNTSALHYKNRKNGILMQAIIPNVVNLLLCAAFLFALKFTPGDNRFFYLRLFFSYVAEFNVCLAVYNLIPITPMDGLKVLSVLLSPNSYMRYLQNEKIIQMIVLLLLYMGTLQTFILPVINMVYSFIYGLVF